MPKSIQDVDSLLEQFQALEDPRVNINRRHLLGDLIVISSMAVIAGADGPPAIGTWAENNKTTNTASQCDEESPDGIWTTWRNYLVYQSFSLRWP